MSKWYRVPVPNFSNQNIFGTDLTLVPVITGVVIASGGEPGFHLFGFIMCIGATAARALKSVLQGILLSSYGNTVDGRQCGWPHHSSCSKDVNVVWYLLFNSTMAYCVLGNAKGAVAVVVSLLIFKNPVSVTGMLGIC
ncbi:hypothetical protein Hanom_Chr13g01206371 [Helianthus anomalus]